MNDTADATSGASDPPSGYAEALAELEGILTELEDDAIDVDVLASRVERAAVLIRFCRTRIHDAQMKVHEIVADLEDLAEASTSEASSEPADPG